MIRCASRPSEVIGARWDEFDLDRGLCGLWIAPAARMKARDKGGTHTAYLSDAAQRVLAVQKGMNERIVFTSTVGRNGPMNHEIFRLLQD